MLLLHAKVLERLPAGWSLLMRVRMVEDAATPSMVSSQRFTLPLLRPGEVWQQYVSISLPWIWSSIQVDISLEQVFISGAAGMKCLMIIDYLTHVSQYHYHYYLVISIYYHLPQMLHIQRKRIHSIKS
jgi:hypothetical protein